MFTSGQGTLDQGFRLLYDETFTMLYRVALRITYSEEAAEDLVHDSYIKALERWDIFPTPTTPSIG